MTRIEMQINNITALGELYFEQAPLTCKKLLENLPLKIDLHYAKFAGQEVFGLMPFIVDLEKRSKLNDLEKGSIAYYPDRQLFCIYYGDLQEEDVDITIIGKLISDEKFIQQMENVKYNQGSVMTIKRERDEGNKSNDKFMHYEHLVDGGLTWDKMPEELVKLMQRRGIMQPGGPIIYAEGETRKLAEVLFEFRRSFLESEKLDVKLLKNVVSNFILKIGGWCGLKDNADVIKRYCDLIINQKENRLHILEDFILYANRLNMWLDLLIPWDNLNNEIKKFSDSYNSSPYGS